LSRMRGNSHVRFLGGKAVVIPLTYPTDPDQPDDINEWLDQFETFDIYEILPEIMEMWKSENKQMSVPKKKRGK